MQRITMPSQTRIGAQGSAVTVHNDRPMRPALEYFTSYSLSNESSICTGTYTERASNDTGSCSLLGRWSVS